MVESAEEVELHDGAEFVIGSGPSYRSNHNFYNAAGVGMKPQLYKNIVLYTIGVEDEDAVFEKEVLSSISRQSFVNAVDRSGFSGFAVIPLEDFDPLGEDPLVNAPEEVELYDGAEFVVLCRYSIRLRTKTFRWMHIRALKERRGPEPKLVMLAMKYLEDNGHSNVKPYCSHEVVRFAGYSREVDAAAIADDCAVVIEYRNVMGKRAAFELDDLVRFIEDSNDMGKDSVSEFSGKRIIGVLAGPAETKNEVLKREMDAILQSRGFLKWFTSAEYDLSNPFQASYDAPQLTDGTTDPRPGNAVAAMPRRLGLATTPMRRAPMMVRPRLGSKSAGFSFSI